MTKKRADGEGCIRKRKDGAGKTLHRRVMEECIIPGLSSSIARGIHITLHNAPDRAVKERLLIHNPADSCVVPKIQHQEMKTLRPNGLNAAEK